MIKSNKEMPTELESLAEGMGKNVGWEWEGKRREKRKPNGRTTFPVEIGRDAQTRTKPNANRSKWHGSIHDHTALSIAEWTNQTDDGSTEKMSGSHLFASSASVMKKSQPRNVVVASSAINWCYENLNESASISKNAIGSWRKLMRNRNAEHVGQITSFPNWKEPKWLKRSFLACLSDWNSPACQYLSRKRLNWDSSTRISQWR